MDAQVVLNCRSKEPLALTLQRREPPADFPLQRRQTCIYRETGVRRRGHITFKFCLTHHDYHLFDDDGHFAILENSVTYCSKHTHFLQDRACQFLSFNFDPTDVHCYDKCPNRLGWPYNRLDGDITSEQEEVVLIRRIKEGDDSNAVSSNLSKG